jgi:hypothetical protein
VIIAFEWRSEAPNLSPYRNSQPFAPLLPPRPHYEFMKKRIYSFFAVGVYLAQKDISGRGGSRGTAAHNHSPRLPRSERVYRNG